MPNLLSERNISMFTSRRKKKLYYSIPTKTYVHFKIILKIVIK